MNENLQNEISPTIRHLTPLRWIRLGAGYCVRTVIGLALLLIAVGSGIIALPVYLIEELSKTRRRKHKIVRRPVARPKTADIQT